MSARSFPASAATPMDVPRQRGNARRVRVVIVAIACAAALVGVVTWLHALRPAAPSIARDGLVFDTATRGTLERVAQGPGTLQPEHVQIVSAPADGDVTLVPLKAGARVTAATTLVRLSNPELEAALPDARAQIAAAQAQVQSARAEAATSHLDREGALETLEASQHQASLEARAYASLHARGLVGDLAYEQSSVKAKDFAVQVRTARAKLRSDAAEADANVSAAAAKADDLQAIFAAKLAQLHALDVRAGAAGVVQQVLVDPGQRVAAGTTLARIADQRTLRAVLAIPETAARDVALGQPATIDTHAGTVAGRVARIDPASQNGSVEVDVALAGPLPAAARPDLTVDGTVEIARVPHALSISRPANAADDSTVDLFKVVERGNGLQRTRVRLGTGSVERVQVLSGLAPGDRVVVSDMSSEHDTRLLLH